MRPEDWACIQMAGPLSFELWVYRNPNSEAAANVRELTAWHESSHAVMAYLLGITVTEIAIVQRHGLGGYALIGDLTPAVAAIARSLPANRPGRSASADSDIRRAIRNVSLTTNSRTETRARVRALYEQTRAMLTDNYYLVYPLAADLMERGRIHKRRILRVLRKAQGRAALMEAHDTQQREEWYARGNGTQPRRRLRGKLPA